MMMGARQNQFSFLLSVFQGPEAGAYSVLGFYDTTRAHLMNQDTSATTLQDNRMNENTIFYVSKPQTRKVFLWVFI